MATVNIGPVFERGRSTVVNQIVAGNTTYTHTIALSRSTFLRGFLLVRVPFVGTVAGGMQRRNASIYITTALADAVSQATATDTVSIPAYPSGILYTVFQWKHKSYFYDAEAKLSDTVFQRQDAPTSTSTGLRITSARINGSNIEIAFENTHPSVPRTLEVEIEWRVENIVYA